MGRERTVGDLLVTGYRPRSVRDEMRRNLIEKLRNGGKDLFRGVAGYEQTVIPQLINAMLSKHNIVLLGLRGQAKTRILRGLISLLDAEIPVLVDSETNEHPYKKIKFSSDGNVVCEEKDLLAPIIWLKREQRYIEKLATADVSMAELIGDANPGKGGGQVAVSYGLLPRANRGIFALQELPDLAAKIQVGLLNILQEGLVQIKSYPIQLPLDVFLVFTANPDDYSAKGKVIAPLKDRIGAEIQTHYPVSRSIGVGITKKEAWINRNPDYNGSFFDRLSFSVPTIIHDVVEQIAICAREDKRVDARVGVSQRLPITVLESAVSNAERRSLKCGEIHSSPRISDVFAAVSAITGKIELSSEGKTIGSIHLARELITNACKDIFNELYSGVDFQEVLDYFDQGNTLIINDMMSNDEIMAELENVSGLIDAVRSGKIENVLAGTIIAYAELVLEGLHAHEKLLSVQSKGQVGYAIAKTTPPPPSHLHKPNKPAEPETKPEVETKPPIIKKLDQWSDEWDFERFGNN